MAYNQKNIIVNLIEEARKGGGGGGQIPALQLAVSQLQVSMTAVKSSVANVSAEVAAIKATLASLNPSTTEHEVGTWVDDRPIYECTFDFGSDLACAAMEWTNTTIPNTGMDLLLEANITSSNGTFRSAVQVDCQSGSYVRIRPAGDAIAARYVTLRYVKVAENRKRR